MTHAFGVAAALGVATVLIAVAEPAPGTAMRHVYLLPIIAAALRFGVAGGILAGVAAVMLYAPFVLPAIERSGLDGGAIEGLVTLVMFATVGPLGGALVTVARRRHARYEMLRAVQHTLAGGAPLESALRQLRACLEERLGATVGLVVRNDAGVVVEGARGLAPASLAARVLEGKRAVFVPDTGGGGRPHRAFGAPLTAGDETIGVLAIERAGELGRDERAALVTLAAHIGLGLENARLASRQRHFTDELARRVAAATERLQEADRAKSAFVAVASHELRTPLTALQGFTELLATREFPEAEVRRIAGLLGREIDRLVRIVDDFLDLSRVERGLAPTLRRAPMAVAPAIAAAADLFSRQSTGGRIVTDCEASLPLVDADPDALARILRNLLSNAIKYARPGGTVRVTARVADGGGAVAIAVEDDGRGIPPEALPRVFEPYYRAPDTAGAARGTGIGLAIVKALVEGHGGGVSVQSEPARGTRVTFTLPGVP